MMPMPPVLARTAVQPSSAAIGIHRPVVHYCPLAVDVAVCREVAYFVDRDVQQPHVRLLGGTDQLLDELRIARREERRVELDGFDPEPLARERGKVDQLQRIGLCPEQPVQTPAGEGELHRGAYDPKKARGMQSAGSVLDSIVPKRTT
jgi:hypothetical protein